ncbi:ABC transporter permease [Methylocucumis oryzae]|uniref:ABC transporter permease n=1 Tax=Methylocucumis oryzae TaxID=1632867 RepID=A0A0F3IE29_9GAMM|nr:ABC transporter permease subunit [Methylocucumis oryzae]KJV05021.1 ABC transporter permease [Methylocucumis oryzae]
MTAFIIAEREFKTLFLAPLAWIILAVLEALSAFMFLTQVEKFMRLQKTLALIDNAPGLTDIVVLPLYGNVGILLLLATPLLTMGVIASERRYKTLTLLLSAPISSAAIILGKFLACWGLLLVLLGLLTCMPLSLLFGGTLDFGKLACNCLALALLSAAFTATGVYFSSLSSHPVAAAISSFGLLLLLWILDWTSNFSDEPSPVLNYLSLLKHFQHLQTGLLSSVDVCFFLLYTGLFLFLSISHLDKLRRQP